MTVPDFGSPTLNNLQFNGDGTLAKTKGQSVLFYNKREMEFRAKVEIEPDPKKHTGACGNIKIDPNTGQPPKTAVEVNYLMVRIETPGDKTIWDGRATAYHKMEYRAQYEHFRTTGGIPSGTLLASVDWVPGPLVVELRYMGIYTIEQLKDATDVACDIMPQLWELRDFAKKWCEINSPDNVAKQAGQLKDEIAALRRENEELKSSKLVDASGRSFVMPSAVEEPAVAPEPIKTMELSPEEFKSGKKGK